MTISRSDFPILLILLPSMKSKPLFLFCRIRIIFCYVISSRLWIQFKGVLTHFVRIWLKKFSYKCDPVSKSLKSRDVYSVHEIHKWWQIPFDKNSFCFKFRIRCSVFLTHNCSVFVSSVVVNTFLLLDILFLFSLQLGSMSFECRLRRCCR